MNISRNHNFRTPDAVKMKLNNFLRIDHNYKGVGLKNGSRLELDVWNKFHNDKLNLKKIAQSILNGIENENELKLETLNSNEEDDFEEEKISYRMHKYRERNNKIVMEKKRIAKEKGNFKCEICEFDFSNTYGSVGKEYIECHHLIPISSYSEHTKTRLEDLILVCSNCHRMLHRKRPWIGKDELKSLIETNN